MDISEQRFDEQEQELVELRTELARLKSEPNYFELACVEYRNKLATVTSERDRAMSYSQKDYEIQTQQLSTAKLEGFNEGVEAAANEFDWIDERIRALKREVV